ncbi:hypothetical protein [Neobacillus cucumis]|uniref:hypothetical protein n=1 Tax=Neobacillus cucumis TaxID=1740721 RepID=UPI001E58C4AA|nr:hypothetical protein [Neobacillus cucumis]
MDHVEVPEVREVMVLTVVPVVREVKEVMALAVVPEVLEAAVPAAVPAVGEVAGQVDEKAQAEKEAVQMEIMVLKVSAASIPV